MLRSALYLLYSSLVTANATEIYSFVDRDYLLAKCPNDFCTLIRCTKPTEKKTKHKKITVNCFA